MLIVGDRDAPKAVSSRERALLMDLEEVLQDLADVRVEHALSRALVAELQEEVGKAAGAEELAAEKISALEQDVEKRKEDDAVMGARVEELEAEVNRACQRLLGVAFEIERLANGGVNIPAVPHEVREHLMRIRALALPAEKG